MFYFEILLVAPLKYTNKLSPLLALLPMYIDVEVTPYKSNWPVTAYNLLLTLLLPISKYWTSDGRGGMLSGWPNKLIVFEP